MPIIATLCYLRKDNKVLMQLKAQGKFGGGKYNAPGGKMQGKETPSECVVRECDEETGLHVIDPTYHGTINHYEKGQLSIVVHLFSARNFSGLLKQGEELPEGQLDLIDEEAIPYSQMWADDPYWLPKLLAGETELEGHAYFTEGFKELLKFELR